jgi:hypothetical protein
MYLGILSTTVVALGLSMVFFYFYIWNPDIHIGKGEERYCFYKVIEDQTVIYKTNAFRSNEINGSEYFQLWFLTGGICCLIHITFSIAAVCALRQEATKLATIFGAVQFIALVPGGFLFAYFGLVPPN